MNSTAVQDFSIPAEGHYFSVTCERGQPMIDATSDVDMTLQISRVARNTNNGEFTQKWRVLTGAARGQAQPTKSILDFFVAHHGRLSSMPAHARTVEILTDKAHFEQKTAFVIAEAIDNAMQESQLVIVSVLDNRLAELRRDIDVRFVTMQKDMELGFTQVKHEMQALESRLHTD
jgi:hypothetical protein